VKQHKPWFDEEDPNQSNVDNTNNGRHEASRHFRTKEKDYLKAKIDELEINGKLKISETIVGALVTLKRVTSVELI